MNESAKNLAHRCDPSFPSFFVLELYCYSPAPLPSYLRVYGLKCIDTFYTTACTNSRVHASRLATLHGWSSGKRR